MCSLGEKPQNLKIEKLKKIKFYLLSLTGR